MAYTPGTITYFMHNRQWVVTALTDDPPIDPWLFAHVCAEVRVGATGAIGTRDMVINGRLMQAYLHLPDFLTGATVTLTLRTEDGEILLNSGPLARGAIHTIVIDRILMGTTTIGVISSAGEAVTRQIRVGLRVLR